MKRPVIAAAALFTMALSNGAWATVITTWDLTNKSPGALGADYGLRLNQVDDVGVGSDSSASMIFDFERTGYGVTLQLVDVGGGNLELVLSGTAYGALFDGGAGDGYGASYDGSYDLQFTWRNVQQGVGGFDYIAEAGLGSYQMGAGTGSVTGTDAGTAWMGGLDLFDFSGSYTYTLDVLSTNNPDASGWLTYDGKGHNGDFGFNLTVSVPEPGTLSLLGLGLFGIGIARRRRTT